VKRGIGARTVERLRERLALRLASSEILDRLDAVDEKFVELDGKVDLLSYDIRSVEVK